MLNENQHTTCFVLLENLLNYHMHTQNIKQYNSFAKINLGLHIVKKRDDGFHEIETFFQQIDLCDKIGIEILPEKNIKISCDSPYCPANESNLAFRAAALLQQKVNSKLGCHIHLEKNTPAGAGLGGGSSNAATVLTALNELWCCNLTTEELVQVGAQLGSDVAFFVSGGLAFGAGRGEILTSLTVKPAYSGVLILPQVHISTKYVYENYKIHLTNTEKKPKLVDFVGNFSQKAKWKEVLLNDLEKVVFAQYPHFSAIIKQLYKDGAFYAAMSGSGSTLFGLFEDIDKAYQAMSTQAEKSIIFNPVYT